MIKALFTCGGTGGHIYPALAVAEKLKEKYGKIAEVLFVGSDYGMERGIIEARGFEFKAVRARPFLRKATFKNVLNLFLNIKAVFEAGEIVKKFAPDFAYGTGGFVSFPVIFAAQLQKVNTAIHEPNMYPGLANRLLARGATRVTVGFGATTKFFPAGKSVVTGNPVRETLGRISRSAGAKKTGISAKGKNILVMPGSRAAKSVNAAVLAALPLLAKEIKKTTLAWMCGGAEYDGLKKAVKGVKGINIKLFKFIEDAPAAYAACDAAVLRAGASTLSEIAAAGMPSLLVPYPHATDKHQEKNARVLEAGKLAIVVRDSELTGRAVTDALKALLDRKTNAKMRKALKKTANRDSAGKIVRILTEL